MPKNTGKDIKTAISGINKDECIPARNDIKQHRAEQQEGERENQEKNNP